MDVIQAGDDLLKYRGDEATSKWATFPRLDEVIEVAFHGLEDKVEFF
jgi:hypothetical protein